MFKFRMHEDDPRYYKEPFDQFFNNCGSFNAIIHELNFAFKRLGILAETEEEADVVGFASGLKLDFGFAHKKRFCIGVFESNLLPEYLIQERRRLASIGNYEYFGLSHQVSLLWESYGFPTETIDLGVDAEFWQPQPRKKNDKFTILSVTACNFRSGINHLLNAYLYLCQNSVEFKNNTKLIIKNTEERAKKLNAAIPYLKQNGYNIEYIIERQTRQQIRDLYQNSDLLVYIPTNTSGGIPILEASAMELPCLVPNYNPTRLYPNCGLVLVNDCAIADVKKELTEAYGLPYTFPEGWIDENKAKLHMVKELDLANHIEHILRSQSKYKEIARENRRIVTRDWTWDKSAEKIVKIFENKYNQA